MSGLSEGRSTGGRRTRQAIAGTALLVALVAGGLLLAQTLGFGRTATSSGVVVAVDSTSPVAVTGFTMRTADATLEHYRIGQLETGGAAFPAVHLREHLVSLLPVVVSYRIEDGERVALRLEDAPLPTRSA